MRTLIIFLIVVLLSACSLKPTESEIKSQVVANILSDGGSDIFEVQNFQKVDGFEKDKRTYIANVKYELVFKKSIKELEVFASQSIKKGNEFEQGMGALVSTFAILALKLEYGNFEAGFRVPKEEKIVLVKTENGWHVVKEDEKSWLSD